MLRGVESSLGHIDDVDDLSWQIHARLTYCSQALGVLTGRNQNYRNGFQQYNDWEKTYAYGEGSSCSSDSESDSDDDKSNGELYIFACILTCMHFPISLNCETLSFYNLYFFLCFAVLIHVASTTLPKEENHSLCLCLSVCLSLSVSFSVCLSVCLSLSLSLSLPLFDTIQIQVLCIPKCKIQGSNFCVAIHSLIQSYRNLSVSSTDYESDRHTYKHNHTDIDDNRFTHTLTYKQVLSLLSCLHSRPVQSTLFWICMYTSTHTSTSAHNMSVYFEINPQMQYLTTMCINFINHPTYLPFVYSFRWRRKWSCEQKSPECLSSSFLAG